MGRIIKIALVIAIVVVGAFAAVVAMQPNDFSISRSAVIAAPAEQVFAQVNDFHLWEEWSPWAKIDPASKVTFEGPTSGKGAIFRWDGNNEVGAGSMTITESKPNELILIDLAFVRPMEGKNLTEFKFAPEGAQTKVTWTMTGKHNFIGKAFCMMMDMQTHVGGMFDKGLASMKKIVESAPKT